MCGIRHLHGVRQIHIWQWGQRRIKQPGHQDTTGTTKFVIDVFRIRYRLGNFPSKQFSISILHAMNADFHRTFSLPECTSKESRCASAASGEEHPLRLAEASNTLCKAVLKQNLRSFVDRHGILQHPPTSACRCKRGIASRLMGRMARRHGKVAYLSAVASSRRCHAVSHDSAVR